MITTAEDVHDLVDVDVLSSGAYAVTFELLARPDDAGIGNERYRYQRYIRDADGRWHVWSEVTTHAELNLRRWARTRLPETVPVTDSHLSVILDAAWDSYQSMIIGQAAHYTDLNLQRRIAAMLSMYQDAARAVLVAELAAHRARHGFGPDTPIPHSYRPVRGQRVDGWQWDEGKHGLGLGVWTLTDMGGNHKATVFGNGTELGWTGVWGPIEALVYSVGHGSAGEAKAAVDTVLRPVPAFV